MDRALQVYINNNRIGKLWLDGRKFCFEYTCLTTPPLSLSLPVRDKPYLNDESRPYFVNLLPEGLAREAITRQLRISWADDFGLLEAIGGDCAGAVRLFPGADNPSTEGSYEELCSDEVIDLVANLNSEPLGRAKMRLSLAGAQTKIPIRLKNGRFYLPLDGAPSTHIIKISANRFPDTVENETFVMMLAKAVGLNVPCVNQMKFGDVSAFIIDRYDRVYPEDGRIVRLLQEDFCQVLGLEPETKYQNTGGPGLEDCFEILDNHSSDSLFDRNQLLKWVAFNVVVGNADAHAKNLSLLYTENGIRLSPFYDLVSTVVYGANHDEELAMSIAGEWDSLKVTEECWIKLAKAIGMKGAGVTTIVYSTFDKIAKNVNEVLNEYESNYGLNATVRSIADIILKRRESIE